MKKSIFLIFVVGMCLATFAQQGVSINEDGALADESAILDVKSEDKGLLIPRVILTSLTSASSPVFEPADGLLVFNKVSDNGIAIGFYYWSEANSQWTFFSNFDGDYNSLINAPTSFDANWSSLTGTPPNISIFNNNAGYLTQTVTMSAGDGIEISGSYPDFNIALPQQSAVKAIKTGTPQNISPGIMTQVSFQAVEYDYLGEFDIAGDKFTANESGLYHIIAKINYPGATANTYAGIHLTKNDVIYEGRSSQTGVSNPFSIHISTIIQLNAGDYIKLRVSHNFSGDVEIDNDHSNLIIVKIR